MNQTAVVVASFGTTYPETERRCIAAVEQAIAQEFPALGIRRAYTSSMVRAKLAKRGQPVDNIAAALERLAAEGVTNVVVQPTLLLYGREYDKLAAAMAPFAKRFSRLVMGRPLLGGESDIEAIARRLIERYPSSEEHCLVLMGHGTDHACNEVYFEFERMLATLGAPHALLGTLEGQPDLDAVLAQVKAGGYRRATLVPLMLVAGEHAELDMAGAGPDSWKSRLEALGLAVDCQLEGLGEDAAIRELYRLHAVEAAAR